MTKGQRRALERAGPAVVMNIEAERGPVEWSARFGRRAPLGVEIGFGMGQALIDWSRGQPCWNLIGVDVYQPGIGALLLAPAQRVAPRPDGVEGSKKRAGR